MKTALLLSEAEIFDKVKVVLAEMLEKSSEEIRVDLTLGDLGANIPEITTALEIEFEIGIHKPFDQDTSVFEIIHLIAITQHSED